MAPFTPASAADLAWLSGIWLGDRAGDVIEEHWSTPAGGAIMGMFRWLHAGQVRFYELMTLEPEDGALILRIKHFHPGLKGWEEKDESVTLVLVALPPGAAVFTKRDSPAPRWLIYRRPDPDTLVATFETEESTPAEGEAFLYTRQTIPQ
jgi:hypothetical protein